MRTLAAALIASALAAAPAAAQSFDCGAATKPDEFAVCDSRSLSNLDVEMNAYWWVLYHRIPLEDDVKNYEHDLQRDFLRTRAACGNDEACIAAAYHKRIEEMKTTITNSMHNYCAAVGRC